MGGAEEGGRACVCVLNEPLSEVGCTVLEGRGGVCCFVFCVGPVYCVLVVLVVNVWECLVSLLSKYLGRLK